MCFKRTIIKLVLILLLPGSALADPSSSAKDRLSIKVLGLSSQSGDLQTVTQLIKKGVDVNAFSDNFTPLMHASGRGYIAIVSLLLTHGAKVNMRSNNRHGITALIAAARYNREEIVDLLLKHKANVNAKGREGVSALMWAAAKGLPVL